MNSFPLLCLLVVAFSIIDHNPVLAKKQICQCYSPDKGVSQKVHEKATKSCSIQFYCYSWVFKYHCEVTPEKRPTFDACCKTYNEQLVGSSCQYIKSRMLSTEIVSDPRDYTINGTLTQNNLLKA